MKKNKKLRLDRTTLRQLTPVDLTAALGAHGHSYYYCTGGCPSNTCQTMCGYTCGSCFCPTVHCPTQLGCPTMNC